MNANAYVTPALAIAQIALRSAATGFLSPQFASVALKVSASQVVGSFPTVDESTPPVYKQVHQEQVAAEPESLERTKQCTNEHIFHVPFLQKQEQLVGGVKEILQDVEQRIACLLATAAHAAPSPSSYRVCVITFARVSPSDRTRDAPHLWSILERLLW